MFTVYVLKSSTARKTYVGFTTNLERRLREHNHGNHSYTKKHIPWSVLYEEKYLTPVEARKREKYFKSAAGRRYLKKYIVN
jgi:putative endonuclease